MYEKTKYIFTVLLLCGIIRAQTFPVDEIIENGPRYNRINIVFLGDGYQKSEMQKYLNDVRKTVSTIFDQSPYKEYKNLFNVFAVEVPSSESGTSHPGTAPDCYGLRDSVFSKDTYFKTTFDYNGIHRLLVIRESEKVYNVLQNNIPDYDMVFMVVNHGWYGGSGGTFSVFSTNIQSAEIAIHEAGHSFAGLGDEYYYDSNTTDQPGFEGINYTWHTQKDSIPWNVWISPGTQLPTPADISFKDTIGLFEGAFYQPKGMYRPKLDCKMNHLYVPFCEVCREQHVKSIFSLISLVNNYSPENDSAAVLYKTDSLEFVINTETVNTGSSEIKWILDDEELTKNIEGIIIVGPALSVGTHTLRAEVIHKTDFVKNDPNDLLTSEVSWHVKVLEPTDVDSENNIPRDYVLEQNYPNPFNPETTIKYSLPKEDHVVIKIYDVLGREIYTLINKIQPAGTYELKYKADKINSGIYFYKISANKYSETKKMLYLK